MSSDSITTIISILVPTIGVQIAFFLFVFRRMDKLEERLVQRMDERIGTSESHIIQRMDASDEERDKMRLEIKDDFKEVRDDISLVQTGLARLEGAVDVLRGLVERFVTVPR